MKHIVLFLVIALLVGCGGSGDAGETVDEAQEDMMDESHEDSDDMEETEMMEDDAPKMSLKDALSFSGSMKCTVQGDQGGMSVDGTYWIKDGKHATDFQIDNERLYTIFDGEYIYSWGHSQLNEGQKFKMEDIESLAESAGVDLESPEEQAEGYDGLEPDCVTESIPDSKFNPPSSVTFNDLGEQLAQMEDMLANLPDGFEMPQ